MRKISIPTSKPRNRVVLSLAHRHASGSGRHSGAKRQQNRERKDMARRLSPIAVMEPQMFGVMEPATGL